MRGEGTTEGMADGKPLVSVRGLAMAFGGVEVLKGVDLDLRPGEVHAITGENGAGKSTLAKLIAGVHRPISGEILVQGKPVRMDGPSAATANGIALIHQEPLTFPDLTVAENIFVGNHPRTGTRLVDWKALNARAEAVMANLGLKLKPTEKVKGLSVADQQMVEVAAALTHDAKVLLLDETTASLTPKEVEELFVIVRRLRDQGCALAFVSHKLEEVFAICDRVTVLRDGEKVGEVMEKDSSPAEIIRMMVGRDIEPSSHARKEPGETLLEVKNLSVPGRVNGVSLKVREGEVVALAGLVGAGRTDVAHAIAGVTSGASGSISLKGQALSVKNPQAALRQGIVLVPEDRQHHGLLLAMDIAQNATLPILKRLSCLWMREKDQRTMAQGWIERLRIACIGPMQPVRELSGGNQQKVVLAKSLLCEPKILIVDEPTRGVDVGAKAEVHRLLRELADQGLGVLMISSDLPEVLAVADRVLVMRAGQIVAEMDRNEASEESIMFAAAGETVHAG
ncbi:MAG: sugar ABC transporter ATP-binding protein [Fimbriimonadaceae bacterium]|nr:sugar ABC transporter ATP-binding protein [Fimbriimonadaceae bacterium]